MRVGDASSDSAAARLGSINGQHPPHHHHVVIGDALDVSTLRQHVEEKQRTNSAGDDSSSSQASPSTTTKSYEPWHTLSRAARIRWLSVLVARLVGVLLLIFVYICALGNLSTAFSLLGGRGLGKRLSESPLIRDPASACIVGMMATVVLQSSTTFVNVLVTMVAANMITVHMAIPMMIGSELGTSLVNSLIALTYAGDRTSFGRAFAAAIIGDVFNICCILVVLPIELITGVIEWISWLIVDPMISEHGITFKTVDLLTDPINKFILEVDEPALRNATVASDSFPADYSFIQRCSFANGSRFYNCPYSHLFVHSTWPDNTIAIVVLISSILVLILCLFGIVALINHLITGRVKAFVRRVIALECPGRWKPLTDYIIMAFGFILTLIVQSNSVFASSLTPIAGAGVIPLQKLYALTLGSNIGTTSSGVLAALTADPARLEKALHMAMCQVIYNVIGTLLFFPIRQLRRIPLQLANKIGNKTATYRWFVLLYLVVLFGVVPAFVVGMSFAPPAVTVTAFVIVAVIAAIIACINIMQVSAPGALPVLLRDWEWLPPWLHSLRPYDALIGALLARVPRLSRYLQDEKDVEEEQKKQQQQREKIPPPPPAVSSSYGSSLLGRISAQTQV